MDDTLFLTLFETIINDISNKNSVNANEIKSFFDKIKYNTLYSIFNNEEIISKIKKDIIINVLIDKGLYDSKPISSGNSSKDSSLPSSESSSNIQTSNTEQPQQNATVTNEETTQEQDTQSQKPIPNPKANIKIAQKVQ